MAHPLQVVVLKPSKYTDTGHVERFRRGFMPNSTVPYVRSMTPPTVGNTPIQFHTIDEYVHTDLQYLSLLKPDRDSRTLLALVGVQSHQFHRALDLAAYAQANGCMVVIGGPHVMTCDTSLMHGRGISFALSEAELVWDEILHNAVDGELQPVYGSGQRWQKELEAPVIVPPSREDLKRYVIPMLGLYPARGCPFLCNFCSVTKIAGRTIRSQSIATTMASLHRAKANGVRTIMFTSDNFNKYSDGETLLQAMIDDKLGLEFFVQCDTQIARQPQLVELLGKAGCFQMFIGVESFNRETLLAARKGQNRPGTYQDIIRLCAAQGISSHFSNIIGFPQDDEQAIEEHLQVLQEMAPSWASFYILCPIPGTEQYDDFLKDGLISEANLDRFDTTCLTWRHPSLSSEDLQRLLFKCYRKFFSAGHALRNVKHELRPGNTDKLRKAFGNMAMSMFSRYCAMRKMHPMSGGIRRVYRDCANDYLHLRKQTFGFTLAPLPQSLQLPDSKALLQLGRLAKRKPDRLAT